jgi:hypothetical protein
MTKELLVQTTHFKDDFLVWKVLRLDSHVETIYNYLLWPTQCQAHHAHHQFPA